MNYKCIKYFLILVIGIGSTNLEAQYSGGGFAISAGYNYTTTSKLFLFPHDADPIIRNQGISLEGIYSYSAEIRYRISDQLVLGFGSEFMERTDKGSLIVIGPSGVTTIKIEEGFSLIPIELTAYYLLPFATEDFKFYMGGGLGYYIGRHIRKFGDADTDTDERELAYGLHVSVGMDYMITPFLSIRGEMKFRDPEFELKSKYNKTEINYKGEIVRVPTGDFDSKINIDGVTFTIGTAFHF